MRALFVLCLLATSAVAQPREEPWAAGVAVDKQDRANALYADANVLFAQQAYAAALAKYEDAIALWDHPLIRFNMAVTLVRMDRYVDAADVLDRALRFDKAPFPTEEQFRQAVDYQKLVAGRIGTLEVACAQSGVEISLDGKRWFTCPGKRTMRVAAGEHAVIAEKPGYMTRSERHVLGGGVKKTASIELTRVDAGQLVYPTRRWIPWSTVAGGAAVMLVGTAVWLSGKDQIERFDAQFARDCAMRCETDLSEHPALRDLRDGGLRKVDIGIATMIAGGAVVVGGAVWALVFNKPRRVQPQLEATPAGATVRATWQF